MFLNIDTFFDELTICLSKAVYKFDNLIVMGGFNIDITKEEFCDTFPLTNLIKS